MIMEVADTFPKLLKRNSIQHPTRIGMRKKTYGLWQRYTWQDYYVNVKYIALGLLSLGLKRGDKICIIGDNSPEWFWAEVAAQSVGGLPAGLFTESDAEELKYVINHSEAEFVVAGDQEQVDKLLLISEAIPRIKKVIYWDPKGLWSYDHSILMSFRQLMDAGKEYEAQHTGSFEQAIEAGGADDISYIAYTSGTTGLPKGAMISHRAFIAFSERIHKLCARLNSESHYFSALLAAWQGENGFACGRSLVYCSPIAFPEDPQTAAEDSREIAPDITAHPPRVWEQLSSMTLSKINDAFFLKRFLYNLFMPVGIKSADIESVGATKNTIWSILYALAGLMVFRPLRDRLGLRKGVFGITAGGSLGIEMFRFYRALKVDIRQVYATTEGGLISCHNDGDIDFHTTGVPTCETEVRISGQGEILMRGPHMFTRYYKDPEATSKKLSNGWFQTGDAGFFVEKGHLVVMDRIADLMDLADGEKFAPLYIENQLRFNPYIRDCMAVGGKGRPYVCVVINIDFDNVSKWAESHKLPFTTFTDLSQKIEVQDLIREAISRVNRLLPESARIRKSVNLHKEFDPDEAELTRTRKLRRAYMEEVYRDLIEALYSQRDEILVDADVKYRDGRTARIRTPIRIMVTE